jgi:phospholipase C
VPTAQRWKSIAGLTVVTGALLAAAAIRPSPALSAQETAARTPIPRSPIQHVVVIFQENHSFDNVLGGICVRDHLTCRGTTSGRLHDGIIIPLAQATDIVPIVSHTTSSQATAINSGQMNGFDLINGCGSPSYACYSQFTGSQIPNLRTLAENYVIADNTFSENPVPSWGGHMDLLAGQLDGFQGDIPVRGLNVTPGPGWGCDSNDDALWQDPGHPGALARKEPSCIPRSDGFGPYRASPVSYIPTILDRLERAGLGWKLYADTGHNNSGYVWSICPTFAECLYDTKNNNNPNPNWVARAQFAADAASGNLPAYSAILPDAADSQHNEVSMVQGDNYIEGLVKDVMNGPSQQWQSTAIFITYDDCGCFYDHVAPPAGSNHGIRVPMVIVSPQAKAAFVDHTQASYDSMLAFVEQNWGLAALTTGDAQAYDFCNSFTFTTLPCTGVGAPAAPTPGRRAPLRVPLGPSPVPFGSTQYTATHHPDPNDPT